MEAITELEGATRSPKIDKESATAEFMRFCEAMDIDTDYKENRDDDDAKGFFENRAVIVEAIMKGSLIVNDEGEPVYTFKGTPLTFHEPCGRDFMAMDGKKDTAQFKKMFHLMGSICRTAPNVFANMPQRHLKICQAITIFFMA